MTTPDDLRYTAEHEWVRRGDDGRLRIGVTSYAQDQLGDIVFVSVPEVGASVQAGDSFGEVESTKSVSEVYAPVSGTVVARNESVETRPEVLNSDPYGEGWLVEIEPADASAYDGLMSAEDYERLTQA